MAHDDALWIVLNDWRSEENAWFLPALRSFRKVSVSSLLVSGKELLKDQWEFETSGEVPLVRWKTETTAPERPTAVVSFVAPAQNQNLWDLAGKINKLTGILLLAGTLGTAYFAYRGTGSQKELDRTNQQISQWYDSLKAIQCSNSSDQQRTITDCIDHYANDKKSLEFEDSQLSACIASKH